MLDLETDYDILSAHSTMAVATPPVYSYWWFGPCVQLLAVLSSCTEVFLQRCGQKMADVTSPQEMWQTIAGTVKNRLQRGVMIQ